MSHKIFNDVVSVHAAAKDCLPGAVVPAPYAVGDTVGVERADGSIVDIERCLVDIAQGKFQGVVRGLVSEGIEIGDIITFQFI